MANSDNMCDVAIQVSDDDWLSWLTTDDWQNFANETILATLQQIQWFQPSEISVLLTNDDHMQQLNFTYRGQEKPTNVLSFPTFEGDDLQKLRNQEQVIVLGDIVLSLATVLREAEQQHKKFFDHIRHLLVHGTLHLLGYDHEDDIEAEQMEALEVEILSKLGLSNPYQ